MNIILISFIFIFTLIVLVLFINQPLPPPAPPLPPLPLPTTKYPLTEKALMIKFKNSTASIEELMSMYCNAIRTGTFTTPVKDQKDFDLIGAFFIMNMENEFKIEIGDSFYEPTIKKIFLSQRTRDILISEFSLNQFSFVDYESLDNFVPRIVNIFSNFKDKKPTRYIQLAIKYCR
jgi:hypothetical protein